MANTDKNVVITPNIGSSTDDPKIVFSGADASTAAQNITVRAYPNNSGTLSFEGSAGQLFSITNSLSGTIFSVNDVSGIPSIEVLDTGAIKLAPYNGNVGIGTSPVAGRSVLLGKSLTGATQSFGISAISTILSDVTTSATNYLSTLSTTAASFTVPTISHFNATQGTIGAGSAITNQYGFFASSSLASATNTVGFMSNIASGSGRYNFYAAGSADNYFAGNVGIGGTPNGSYRLTVSDGTTQVVATAYASQGYFGTATNHPLLLLTANAERMRIDSSGNVIQTAPTTAPTLATNGTMVFNLTSNTNLRVSVRGSDGVTRTANITLA